MTENLRLLMVEGALGENGGTRLTIGISQHWRKAGADVRLLVLETLPEAERVRVTLDPDLSTTYASKDVRRFRSAVRHIIPSLIKECRRADVVIATSEVGYGLLLGWLAAKVTRKPFAVIVHAPIAEAVAQWRPAKLRPSLLRAHRRVDAALCVSDGLVSSVVENGLPADKVTTFLGGIDVAATVRRGTEPLTVPRPERPVAVAVGRLAQQKGFDVLLEAHAAAYPQAPHQLLIVGEGPERERLEAKVADLGITDSVQFAGFVPNPQPMIAGADLFVMSSRYEGLGLVLLEALAHCTPIISTDCLYGPKKLLRDGELGELVPTEDPDALSDALVRHFTDPSRLSAKAAQGRSRAEEFDQSDGAEQLLDQVKQLVARRR